LHVYEVRPRKEKRSVDLISDAPPFSRLCYDAVSNAIGYAMRRSRAQDARFVTWEPIKLLLLFAFLQPLQEHPMCLCNPLRVSLSLRLGWNFEELSNHSLWCCSQLM
jgi:hypothetical protein